MLNEEGIKALLPPPKTQTQTVQTEPPVLETGTPATTLPPGTVIAGNPPLQNDGDRLIFDPADFTNFNTVTAPPSAITNATANYDTTATKSPSLETQIPQTVTIPDTKPPTTSPNYGIIISVALILALIAIVVFVSMRRRGSNSGLNTSVPNMSTPTPSSIS